MDSKYLEEIKAKCSANTNGATLISNKALLSLTSKVETLKGENKSLIRKVGEYYKQYDTLKKALKLACGKLIELLGTNDIPQDVANSMIFYAKQAQEQEENHE